MITSQKLATSLVALSLAFAALPALADVVVIVSAKSGVSALTEEQAADIFLGKASAFPGGEQAVPIDQPDGANAKDAFYAKVSGKNAAQLKAYWSKQIFSGKGKPPKEAGDSGAVKSLVSGNPNIVGYVDKSVVDASVKVVLTIK